MGLTYRDWQANTTNPCNVQARPGDPWLGQVGVAPDQRAIFLGPIFGVLAAREVLLGYARSMDPDNKGVSLGKILATYTGRPAVTIHSYIDMVRLLIGGRSGDLVIITECLPKLIMGIIAGEHTWTGPAEMVVDAALALVDVVREDK